MNNDDYLGKVLTIRIDRKFGSKHPKHGFIYPINYGYVEGVFAGDGKEQDVYILGADRPLETFEGKVISVYRRFNDDEDKWIVSLDETEYTDEEIMQTIYFQEQYFDGVLIR